MLGPIASFASGKTLFTASASTCDAECLITESASLSFNVIRLSSQSLSISSLKSCITPFTSPATTFLAKPSLMSLAISIILFLLSYSFTEPSFNVIFIFPPFQIKKPPLNFRLRAIDAVPP